jgi:hypothetical protein
MEESVKEQNRSNAGEVRPWQRIRKHKKIYIYGWGLETIIKVDVYF